MHAFDTGMADHRRGGAPEDVGDEAGLQVDREARLRIAAHRHQRVLIDDPVDAVGGVGRQPVEQRLHARRQSSVTGPRQHDRGRSARDPGHRQPGRDLAVAVQRDQACVDEGAVEIDGRMRRFEPMVAHQRDDRVGMRPHFRSDQVADDPVDLFQHSLGRRRSRRAGMFLMIERSEIDGQEIGLVRGDQGAGEARAILVRRQAFVDAHRIGLSHHGLQLRLQPRRRQRVEQPRIVGMARAPDLRQVPCHALRRDADGPVDIAGGQAGLRRRFPQHGRPHILRIPVPAALVDAHRIEAVVGDDAMAGRRHTGHQRGVAGIGQRRHHAGDAGRMRALLHETAQIGNGQPALVRLQHVAGPQPVDRDEEDGLGPGEGRHGQGQRRSD